jgi:hypothetical protein
MPRSSARPNIDGGQAYWKTGEPKNSLRAASPRGPKLISTAAYERCSSAVPARIGPAERVATAYPHQTRSPLVTSAELCRLLYQAP